MSRGGKAHQRRQFNAGKTGSHRNAGGTGFSKIPIAARERPLPPITHARTSPAFPLCAQCREAMRFEQQKHRKAFWWVCYRCKSALPYKPLKTGAKPIAASIA